MSTIRIKQLPDLHLYDDAGNLHIAHVTQQMHHDAVIGGGEVVSPGRIRNTLLDGTPVFPADGFYWSPERERRFSLTPPPR